MVRTSFFTAVFLVTSFMVTCPKAQELEQIPDDTITRQNAFIDAWLAWRDDLDGMADSAIHPKQFKSWFDEMPAFLARDAARLSTVPQVILAAANRLADLGGAQNRLVVTKLWQIYENTDLGLQLWGCAIRAGDIRAKQSAENGLHSPLMDRQIAGASALAAAGHNESLRVLLRQAKKIRNAELENAAVRALGRWGREADEAIIRQAVSKNPDRVAPAVALGELLCRHGFTNYYQMIVFRDSSGARFSAPGGLYDTWFEALGRAASSGARTPTAIYSKLKEMRHIRPPCFNVDQEVYSRRVGALMKFWKSITDRFSISDGATWPKDFDTAMATIGTEKAQSYVKRVFAEILVCTKLGDELDFNRLSFSEQRFRILTPGGGRAFDGNLATSWRSSDYSTFVMEFEQPQKIESIWIMNSCPSADAVNFKIRAQGSENWTKKYQLDGKTRYFQRFDLDDKLARRIELAIGDPVCIAEIRVFVP